MANKKLLLNIGERVAIISTLKAFEKLDLDVMVDVLDDLKELDVKEEEWKKAELVYTDNEGNKFYSDEEFRASQRSLPKEEKGGQLNWNDEKGGEKEIELKSKTVELLRDYIKEKNDKKEFKVSDMPFIKIREKLA